jgi:hypothetical protein
MTVAGSAAIDAVYLEHRLCGELESVEDLDGGQRGRVWIYCRACDASGSWTLAAVEEGRQHGQL